MKILPINYYGISNNYSKKAQAIRNILNIPSEPDNIAINNKNSYPNSIAFEGVSVKGITRQRGLYHHISALPAKGSFCGQFLDLETTKFINFLVKAKQTHWIVNPLNEITEDMCPYNPVGRFGKNKYLVNMNVLTSTKYGNLLKKKELSPFDTSNTFTLDMLKTQKDPMFEKAYNRFIKLPKNSSIKKEFNDFCNKNNSTWLDTYAIYDVISRKFGKSWYQWDKSLITAPEKVDKENSLDKIVLESLKKLGVELSPVSYQHAKNLYKFEQFLFNKQFNDTLDLLKQNNLKIMTDFPIGVCADGVDTWFQKDMFLLDKETLKPIVVTGCPSQKNGADFTQVWGHAQLDFDKQATWDYLETSLNQMLAVSDVRLDHFAAYANRAKIPTKYKTNDGRVLEGNDIFKEKPFGMGVGFFEQTWIEDIASKKNPKNGENIFDLFIRLAKQNDKDVKDAYMIESLGKLTKEPAYIEKFEKKYGDYFTHQRAVFPKNLNDPSIEQELGSSPRDFVVLTSNHDKPSLRDSIKALLIEEGNNNGGKFTDFCKKELKLDEKSLLDIDSVQLDLMKWFYTKFKKHHIHTTLMDALSLEGRFNIPGTTNASEERYLMSPTPEGLVALWTQVMPKEFLDKIDKNGNHAGYKDRAEKFIKLQKDLNVVI